jgi:hypothetical protein
LLAVAGPGWFASGMTTPDENEDDLMLEDANPLLVPLEPVQVELLNTIVWPITLDE